MKSLYNNNPKLLNNFLDYLLGILNYSEKTIKGYNLDLLQFFRFIKEYYNLKIEVKDFNIVVFLQVKESDIIAFLVYLNFNRDNNPNTRQRKLCAIRRFYKWLLSNIPSDNNKVNPTSGIRNIQKVERLPKYLNLQQAQKIQHIFTIENSRTPIRNNAIISLFLNSGVRVGELININIRNVNFTNKSIKINGKGKKERTIYFSESCKKQLIKYLKTRANNNIINLNDPLFISIKKERLRIDGIEDICKKAYKLMGLEEYGYTTHTLRHTAATLMYMYVSQDILLLKEFLGHERISTTEIYTHVYNKELKEAVEKNPLNTIKIAKKKAA